MEIIYIPLDLIDDSELNVRNDLSAGTEDASLDDLAMSIQEVGLHQPILVRSAGDRYQLVAGRRRVMACRSLGHAEIASSVLDVPDDDEAVIISLTENFHRADMSPVDKAMAFSKLFDVLGSYEEVSKRVCLAVPTVRKYAVLMNLADSIRDTVGTSEGSEGVNVLSELAKRFDPEDQEEALDIVEGLKSSAKAKILRESDGSLDALPEIRIRVLEELGFRVCRESLCPILSVAVRDTIKGIAESLPHMTLLEFRNRFVGS